MKITFEEFDEAFKLKRNPIAMHSPYENTMLDFGDEELDYLDSRPRNTVWSLVDSGKTLKLIQGIQYNNAIGYFATEKAASNGETYILK